MCEDTSSTGQVKDVIDAVKGLTEAVPVYEDAIQPAAKEVGKGLAVVAKSINVALSPLKAIVWGYEQFEEFISTSLADRLKNTPEEDIVTPKLAIAGPAMEALRYAGEEEEIRDMFANLLANSMDKKTASLAHPAFIEILKNMNPDEAKVMKLFATNDRKPIIDLNSSSPDSAGQTPHLQKFSIIGYEAKCEKPKYTPNYLDNLIRLGLLEAPFGLHLSTVSLYEPLLEHPTVKELEIQLKAVGRKLEVGKRLIDRTNLGSQFCMACVMDKVTSPLSDLFG